MITQELVVFEVAGREFSIPLELVEEVVPAGLITPVPNSPSFPLGLTAVRGKVMGVIDASKRYGIGPALNSFFLICYVRGNVTAITIDRAVVAGEVTVRPLEAEESKKLKEQLKVDPKFLKNGFELLELVNEGKETRATGLKFSEIDPDLFVSHEMASKVGDI